MNDANMNEAMEEGRPRKRPCKRPCKRPRTADQQSSSQGEATNLSDSFSTIPPEILDKILNKSGFPLREQMRLRTVSPRFRDVIEAKLRQKTTLSLIVGSSSKKHNLKPKPDLIIKIARFNTEKCIQSIGRLFPRVTKLIFYSDSITAWRKAPGLIRLYATQLKTLKVNGYLVYSDLRVFQALGESVNSMANSLRSLDLRVNSKYSRNSNRNVGRLLLPHIGPTLSRLNRFICTGRHMKQYATLISTSRLPRCAHLHLIKCSHTVLQSVSQFKRLRSLTLFFNYWALNDFDSALLQQLRPLSLLKKFNLVNVEYRRPLEAPPSKAFTFPNVTRLTLQLTFLPDFHLDAEHLLLTLATWFPNLSDLTLFTYGRFIEEIEASKQTVPYTVILRKKKLTSHSTFW